MHKCSLVKSLYYKIFLNDYFLKEISIAKKPLGGY